MFYVTVEVEFDFVCSEDGSTHTVKTFGEAMDRSDKATNKAMSAAYKYAAFQAFAIPTEGDNDADSDTPEVKSKPNPLDKARAEIFACDGVENAALVRDSWLERATKPESKEAINQIFAEFEKAA